MSSSGFHLIIMTHPMRCWRQASLLRACVSVRGWNIQASAAAPDHNPDSVFVGASFGACLFPARVNAGERRDGAEDYLKLYCKHFVLR